MTILRKKERQKDANHGDKWKELDKRAIVKPEVTREPSHFIKIFSDSNFSRNKEVPFVRSLEKENLFKNGERR